MTAGRRPTVTVYGARDCGLCGPVKATVEQVARRLSVAVEHVDITGVDALERRFRTRIPVVEIDGEHAFHYHVDATALERRLRDAGAMEVDPRT